MTTKQDHLVIPSSSDATKQKRENKDMNKHNNVSAVININSINSQHMR